MKIALDAAPAVLVDYMEKAILPKAAGWQKFAVGATMFAMNNRAQSMIQDPALLARMKAVGVLGEDNLIDMDYARDMALSAMEKAGGRLPAMGYVLDATDIEALYESAKIVRMPS